MFELYNVTYEDSGWYSCIASNGLGSTVASAYLNVVESEYCNILSIPNHVPIVNSG